jgi:predicted adenine nucleotide alpha hydrolase (AANH) superfamily ATPase
MTTKPKILVQICCAPDALYVIDLLQKTYKVTGYFYNPNIHPPEEYTLRLEEARKVAQILNFRLLEDVYDDKQWFELTEKFKDAPEKGKRCDVCYAMRLKRTAQKASELGFEMFTTIMSLSPWKKVDVINKLGQLYAQKYNIQFLEADFKKKDGFRKSVELSKRHKLYRQNYCGCVYSKRGKISKFT